MKTEEYAEKLNNKFDGQIEVVGTYVTGRTPILHRCTKCGFEFQINPTKLLERKNACLNCTEDIFNRKGMIKKTRKKTNEQFLQQLSDKWGDKLTPLTEYDGNKTKIKFRCNECGNEFMAKPNDVLSGWTRWCPVCSNRIMGENAKKTHDEYVKDLKKVWSDKIIALEEYSTNRNIPILHRCNECGFEWKTTPHNLLSGEGCPNCKKKTISELKKKSQEQYEQELREVWGDRVILVDEYKTTDTPIYHMCGKCGHKWKVSPHNLLSGRGTCCPKCNMSKGEVAIDVFLTNNNIKYEFNRPVFEWLIFEKKMKPDFWLPDYNLVIEYNGEQHYMPIEQFGGEDGFKVTQLRDELKRKQLNEHGVDLLEIPYWEYNNISKILDKKLK